jgi:hypothetical protein
LAIKENILDLQVSMLDWWVQMVHNFDALADLSEDLEALSFIESLILASLHNIKEGSFGHELKQAVKDI